jgi:uncharacterized protein YbjQ (UPF0145 family)
MMTDTMMIVTTENISGFGADAADHRGLVTAQGAIGLDFLASWQSPFHDGMLYSGDPIQDRLTQLLNNLRRLIADQASHLGGNAVVGFSVSYTPLSLNGEAVLMVSAQGTAIQLRSR